MNKKLMRRVFALCLFLCAILLLGKIPTAEAAGIVIDSGTCGENITWKVDEEGVLTISGTGPMADLDVNDYEDLNPWASYDYWITSIVIEKGVTHIGAKAFYEAYNVTNVVIADGVESIGMYAFYGCENLKKITVPASVTDIKYFAFLNCGFVTAGPIGSGYGYEFGWTDKICDYAFAGCQDLEKVIIPDGITAIGNNAFYNCWKLKKITVPESVESIGSLAFSECGFVTAGPIGGGYDYEFGWKDRICEYALAGCQQLMEITFPAGITEIGKSAFWSCEKLTKVVIPDTVTTVGDSAFGLCNGLTSLTIPGSVTTVGLSAFGTYGDLHSAGPIGGGYDLEFGWTETIPDNALSNCYSLKTVHIPAGITSIGADAFHMCSSLERAIIPEGVTSIGSYAFQCCKKLEYVSLPSTLKTVGRGVFTDMGGSYQAAPLYTAGPVGGGYDLEFAWKESIPSYAFYDDTNLTSIVIPEGVTSIGSYAFGKCGNLTKLTIPGSVTTVESMAFYSTSGFTTAGPIGGGYDYEFGWTENIPSFAFYDLYRLTYVQIPGTVKSIGGMAFSGCRSLTSAGPIGGGYDYEFGWTDRIADNAFEYCSNITSMVLPDSITEIGDGAFMSCTRLPDFKLPSGLKHIGDYAFTSCNNFVNVEIPDSVTSIGEGAFASCLRLETINIPKSVKRIEEKTFSNCKKIASLEIPSGITYIGNEAFKDDKFNPLIFSGNAPEIAEEAFKYASVTAYYPAGNATWTADRLLKYGGGIQWIASCGNHSFSSTPTYTWASNNTSCTASINCTNAGCQVVQQKETVRAKAVTEAATCTKDGSSTYTAVFKTAGFETQVLVVSMPATGHNWYYGICTRCRESKPTEPTEPTEPTPTDPVPEKHSVTRVYGDNRYDTAIKAADTLKQLSVSKFNTVVVASGTGFADALSGSYLAAVKDAPILLVRDNNNTLNQVKNYIQANLAKGGTVYLLGGVNAVPKAMETGLDGFNVKRLGGATRYETNLLILEEAGVAGKNVLVCTGNGFADSLSASAAKQPILLVKDSLNTNQKNFLSKVNGKLYIIGGTSAVNTRIENQLKSYGNVKRLGGATRYITSAMVAEEFFTNPKAAVLAYSDNFPDGLSGGALACGVDAPLILTKDGKDSPAVTYTKDMGIKDGFILGGPTLISDRVVRNVFSMSASDTINVVK